MCVRGCKTGGEDSDTPHAFTHCVCSKKDSVGCARIASVTEDEDVARAAVEHELDGAARVGAAEHDGKRLLPAVGHRGEQVLVVRVKLARHAGDVALVARVERGERLLGRHGHVARRAEHLARGQRLDELLLRRVDAEHLHLAVGTEVGAVHLEAAIAHALHRRARGGEHVLDRAPHVELARDGAQLLERGVWRLVERVKCRRLERLEQAVDALLTVALERRQVLHLRHVLAARRLHRARHRRRDRVVVLVAHHDHHRRLELLKNELSRAHHGVVLLNDIASHAERADRSRLGVEDAVDGSVLARARHDDRLNWRRVEWILNKEVDHA
eukprot:6206694-Pleurochrysis_carterae.AAC.2